MTYIEQEAQKNQSVVDTIIKEFNKALPDRIADANNIGNLLGATTSAFANLLEKGDI